MHGSNACSLQRCRQISAERRCLMRQRQCSVMASCTVDVPPAGASQPAQAPTGHQHIAQDHLMQLEPGSTAGYSRRGLFFAAAAYAPIVATVPTPLAQAAAQTSAAGTCQLQDSPTGLKWCDLTVGTGQLPINGAFTKLNYTAKLASTGQEFDSTYQRRQPLIFKVGECEVVLAFDAAILGAEGIPPMREGGKRLVVVPPGPMQRQGVKSLTWVAGLLDAIEEAGEPISPEGAFNSTLVFEIELVPKRRG